MPCENCEKLEKDIEYLREKIKDKDDDISKLEQNISEQDQQIASLEEKERELDSLKNAADDAISCLRRAL